VSISEEKKVAVKKCEARRATARVVTMERPVEREKSQKDGSPGMEAEWGLCGDRSLCRTMETMAYLGWKATSTEVAGEDAESDRVESEGVLRCRCCGR
jgi:hypothetical protein